MATTIASQLAVTIYLPSLPTIAADLGVAYGTAQLTLSAYLFAFAFAQLAVGPLSDRVGRRPVLLGGLALFTGASMLCAAAPGADWLIAARLVQACGACAAVVLGRAIVRDSRSMEEAPRAMGYMAAAMALAPALAPLAGGQMLVWFGWRSIFWLTAGCGFAAFVATALFLAETAQRRSGGLGIAGYFTGFAAALAQRRFVGLMIATVCASSAFNVFFSGGPILLIGVMGVAAETFGWFTLAWAGHFVVGSMVSNRLQRRTSSLHLVAAGQIILTVGALGMVATAIAGHVTPAAIVVPLMVMGFGNGLNMPNATAGALAAAPAGHVGAASALLGFVQMLVAAGVTVLIGHVSHDTQFNIGLAIAIIGLAGLSGWAMLVRPGRGA